MTNPDFGARVKARRLELGWSQARLAEDVGISQVAIKKIEAGGATRHGWKIAQALQIPAAQLEDSKPDSAPALPPPPWPFADISPDEYQSLSTYDKKMVENLAKSMLEEKRKKNSRPSVSEARSQAMEKGRQRAAARRHGELQHMPKK